MASLIDVKDCPCDGCEAKPCGHPARCVKFALWLNKTVDAVEVVRCKDCKHWLKDVPGCTYNVGRCEWAGYMVGAAGFCVYGERKNNG